MPQLYALVIASLAAVERAAGPLLARGRSMTPEEMWAAAKFSLIAGSVGAVLFLSRRPLIRRFPGNDAVRVTGNLMAAAGVLGLFPLGIFVLSVGSMAFGVFMLGLILVAVFKALIGWGKEG